VFHCGRSSDFRDLTRICPHDRFPTDSSSPEASSEPFAGLRQAVSLAIAGLLPLAGWQVESLATSNCKVAMLTSVAGNSLRVAIANRMSSSGLCTVSQRQEAVDAELAAPDGL
jgi:hypothetical protein